MNYFALIVLNLLLFFVSSYNKYFFEFTRGKLISALSYIEILELLFFP